MLVITPEVAGIFLGLLVRAIALSIQVLKLEKRIEGLEKHLCLPQTTKRRLF